MKALRGLVWLIAAVSFLCGAGAAQTAAAGSDAQADRTRDSLGAELSHLHGRELHIFFVHGIGSDGPGVHDSLPLRQSICAYLKDCLSPAGRQVGNYDYADSGQFASGEPPPALSYMGRPVWNTPEEWAAAAPFVVHYRLERASGDAVYVDEVNWWPLVFSLKCREIVATDAQLVGPSSDRIKTCSTLKPDKKVQGRFCSYDWIPKPEAEQLLGLPKRGALANRAIKNSLMDWGFSDAVMSLGPLHTLLVDGLRQLILKSVMTPVEGQPGVMAGPKPEQEFVIVAHSLGSYLIFSALNFDPAEAKTADAAKAKAFQQVMRQTSLVYFFANQVPLLELADLDESPGSEFVSHLESWGKLRCEFEETQRPDEPCALPRVVALSDPSDLLTWKAPPLKFVKVHNYLVKNAIHWFWLIEDPTKAHDNYQNDRRAIRAMLHPPKAEDQGPVN